MQETAFANPIRKSEQIFSQIGEGKFNKLLPYTNHWFASVCLTISPEDDNQNHFWAASLAYISKATGKAKSRLLWSKKETMIAKDILNFLLEEVGLVDEESGETNPVRIFGKKIALHAHKNLSEIEKEIVSASLEELNVKGN